MGGFDLSFYLAFEPQQIYEELLVHPRVRHPLGAAPNVAFAILRPGYDPKNEVCMHPPSLPRPRLHEKTHIYTRVLLFSVCRCRLAVCAR